MSTITSTNAILMLAVTGVFNVAQQLQQFSAEDIYDSEGVELAEIVQGVDGNLTGGLVHNPTKQSISLMADSPSNLIFEAWDQAQQAAGDLFFAQGGVTLKGTGRSYTMTRGILTTMSKLPDAKKTLQPRKYVITWQNVAPTPI